MVLAPMADVTDEAFRAIIAKYSRHTRKDGTMGGPDVFWTEFVSADGLCSPGRDVLLRDLKYSPVERPIVAQFFTSTPSHMERVARMAESLGFDGIDINMGCPDKSIEKQGAGAAMMTTPDLAVEIIRAAKQGAGGIPVSVKTRVGWNTVELETWLPKLLSAEPAVITVHARTRKEMSLVPARWEHVARAVEIRNTLGSKTLILGNGDVQNLAEAETRVTETGADGVMIGRGIFGNPWLFSPDTPRESVPLPERLRVMSTNALSTNSSTTRTSSGGSVEGATIDSSLKATGKLTITYDGTTNVGGRTRSGSIILQLAGAGTTKWHTAGAVLTITFNNYKATRLSDNKSITINGSKTITNVNGGSFTTLSIGTGSLVHKMRSSNMMITFDDNTQRTWSVARTRTITRQSNGFTISTVGDTTISGTPNVAAWGTTRLNSTFYSAITSPVIWNTANCLYAPVSGVRVVGGISRALTITYGVDSNGNAATGSSCPYGVKLAWTNASSQSETAVLAY